MTHKIITKHGVFTYSSIELHRGRKFLDIDISRQNLLDFKEFADQNNLPFGIIFGTLLGAVRGKHFIEYDEDTDIYILDEHRDHLLSLLYKLRKIGFEVVRYDKDLLSIMRDDEYIDIYIFRKTIFNERVANEEGISAAYFESFSQIEFLGTDFNTLKNPIKFLEYAYGKDWMIPQRNKPTEAKNFIVRAKKAIKKLVPKPIVTLMKNGIKLG